MKIVMTKLRKDGTIENTQAMYFNANKFKRIHAPHLSNENICDLKRYKRIEIPLDEGKLVYALYDSKETS